MTESSIQLLEHARDLLGRASPRSRGLWPRAAPLLTRQALEQTLDQYWHGKGLRLGECSTTAQLLCLGDYSKDAEFGGELHHTWVALSRACHHHPYEMAPTVGKLERWLTVITNWSR